MSPFGKSGSGTRIPGLRNGKARQYLLVAAVMSAIYLALYVLFAASDGKKKAAPIAKDEVSTTQISAAGSQLDPRESWIGGAGARVAQQESRLQRQEQSARAMAERLARLERELQRKTIADAGERNRGRDAGGDRPEAAPAPSPAAVPTAAPTGFPPSTPSLTAARIAGAAGFPVMPEQALTPAPPPPPPRGIGRARIAPVSDAETAEAKAGGTESHEGADRKAGKTFLPIGLVRAVMLGGLDAPTGGQAQNQSLPVMLKLTDLGILPNHFRANVKDCFAVGAAWGDIAAERAYIRLVTLSCVRKDGQALEVAVNGHVFDETGKLGVRGRLVSKQGQILANALLAGVVSGIGRGIEYSTSTSTITALGNTVSQPESGREFQAGIGQGVGKAMDRLANYYISLAEKVFPVIEVDAQRHVDLAFTKGVELDIPLPELAYGDFDDE